MKVHLNDHTTIDVFDTFDVKIGYACATATLTVPSTPFIDDSIKTSEAAKTLSWTDDSSLVNTNS